jgi:CBS domain-containing protein
MLSAMSTTPRTQLCVGDLMSSPVMSIDASDSLDHAKAEMKFGHVRHLPVVDAEGRVIGLLAQSDVLANAWHAAGASVPVLGVMRREVLVVTGDTPIHEAIALMVENHLGALPVVDADGHLVGILTEMDFLLHLYRDVTGAPYLPSWLGRPSPM